MPSKQVPVIRQELHQHANPADAEHLQRFFKTGEGEYGAGDQMLGIRVPQIRALVKKYRGISLTDSLALLASAYHEERLLSLLFMVDLFERANVKGDDVLCEQIYEAYLDNTAYINNWDLVDLSCYKLVGPWLLSREKSRLHELARSTDLWERRIAIVSTMHFIRLRHFEDTLRISEILLQDKQDLIHKAVGWMLREVGNRDLPTEEAFLQKHYHTMPRTMLRYAIEKFPEPLRQAYLKGTA
jgi:3-methyladenine DNA glycosylase AlkD